MGDPSRLSWAECQACGARGYGAEVSGGGYAGPIVVRPGKSVIGPRKNPRSTGKKGFQVTAVKTQFPGIRWLVTTPVGDTYQSAGGFYDGDGETAYAAAVKAGWLAVRKGTYTKGMRGASR